MFKPKSTKGFTLIELLVVISVIGIIASVLFANINEGGAQSRDAKRQADLRNLQSALELYKNREGEYPAGCRGANNWSWQSGVGNDCPSGTKYIEGLAPAFIRVLPVDPKTNGDGTGYAYLTNNDRTVYKLVAFRTVEELSAIDSSNTMTRLNDNLSSFRLCNFAGGPATEEFRFCSGQSDIGQSNAGSYINYNEDGIAGCNYQNDDMQNSYAVWGGLADANSSVSVRQQTEAIICVKP